MAITVGCLLVIVLLLLTELVYIFIAVGYNALAKDYPMLNEIRGVFSYIVGIPVVMAVMFTGGYVTAAIANTRVLLHCLAVGLITTTATMYAAMENASITITGVVVFILALASTSAGGLYFKNNN